MRIISRGSSPVDPSPVHAHTKLQVKDPLRRSDRRSERFIFATEIDVVFYAGPLPKVLPVLLEVLNFGVNYGNNNKFTGGIPSEWGALTNLKELKVAYCGLGGKPLSIRSERVNLC